MDLTSFGLAFIEGMGLILSPCILPILPLILATGIQGGKLRPYGIITGFILAFVIFTLFARQLFSTIDINPMLLQDIAIYLILAFGVILYSDYLSESFAVLFQKLANYGQTFSQKAETRLPAGYWSGVLIGGAIAFIWTPCAGPIMAAVLVQTIQQQADYQAALLLTAFSLGVAVPMLIITLFSKSIIGSVRALSGQTRIIRKVLACIIIITMLFTKFNVWQKLINLGGPTLAENQFLPQSKLLNDLDQPYPAPEIGGIKKWFNSKPLVLRELSKQGKLVLIDFWTYSCINCVRTLPYIKSWDAKYRDKGLVIIGVHAPEFEFEKNEDNVEKAIKDDGIKYPVAMDNDLVTWGNFKNNIWPAHYLINKDGMVVYIHFGEGEYDVTENNIRYLLGLGNMGTFEKPKAETRAPYSPMQSPETYLGYQRTTGFSSDESFAEDEVTSFTFPKKLEINEWALQGPWMMHIDRIVAQKKGSALRYHFRAKQVYLVMAPAQPGSSQMARVLLDGKPISQFAGKDIKDSRVKVDKSTLYQLVNFKDLASGILEVQAEELGLQFFVFTFGAE